MSEWQPIETAPKDGTVILGWRYYPVAIRWTNDRDYPWEAIQIGGVSPFLLNGFVDEDQGLTHWMPLPKKPEL